MLKILLVNLQRNLNNWLYTAIFFIGLTAASVVATQFDNSLLFYLFGTIVLIWPAWLISGLIFNKDRILNRLIISPALMVVYNIGLLRFYNDALNFTSAYTYFLLLSALILILDLLKEQFFSSNKDDVEEENHWDIILAVGLAYTVLALGLTLYYPFLRQVDSYYFKAIIDNTLVNESYPDIIPYFLVPISERYETGLQTIIISWSILSKISTAFIFRYGTVLLGWYLLPLYGLLKTFTHNRLTLWLSLASVFTLSALMLEMVGLRPQGFVLSLALAYLYFLTKLQFTTTTKHLWQNLIAAFICLVALKFTHVIFMLLIPLLPLALIIKFWQRITVRPLISLFWTIISCLVIYPYIIIFKIDYLFKGFIDLFFTGKINFNHLLNPSFGLVTYVANFAIFLPTIFIIGLLLLLIRKISTRPIKAYFLSVVYFIIFFAFMEIMPRIGVVLAPERSFLYVGLGLIVLNVPIIDWLLKNNQIFNLRLMTGLLGISIVMMLYQAFLPQYHIINQAEIDSFRHVVNRYNPPPLIITPAANHPIVVGYTKGLLVPADQIETHQIFSTKSSEKAANLISKYKNFDRYLLSGIHGEKEQFEKALNSLSDNPSSDNFRNLSVSETHLNNLRNFTKAFLVNKQRELDDYKTLIIYSHVKDQSFLSRFDWFIEKAMIGADLDKFADQKFFEPIFSNEFISAWEVK